MLSAVAALLLAQGAPQDYGKLLKDAKLGLGDAIGRGQKEIAGGTALSAYIEADEGQTRFFVFVAKGKETTELTIDPVEGKILQKKLLSEGEAKDDAKIAGAVKITLQKAIELALKKQAGQAVYADFDVDEKGPPEAEVDVYADGKVMRVYVNAVSGDILKTEEKK
jgi:uncharacterized membrane protein YkoI